MVIMETLRYTCVQISPLWFASLRSESSYKEKCPKSFFIHDCRGNTEILCVPSFTSMQYMVCKFEK